MDHIKRILTRASVVVGVFVLAVAVFAVMKTKGQATNEPEAEQQSGGNI